MQHIQSLEPRQLLAGNVTAVYDQGRLTITGDDDENYLRVVGLPGSQVRVEALGNTKLNGGPAGGTQVFPAPVNGLEIDVGGGYSNGVEIVRVRAGGQSRIVLPSAPAAFQSDNDLTIANCRFSDLEIDADTLENAPRTLTNAVVAIRRTVIAGNLTAAFSNGNTDVLGVRLTTIGGGASVTKTYSGSLGRAARITFNACDVGGVTSISSAGGSEEVELLNSTFDSLSVRTRGGDDRIVERNTQYRVSSSIDAGTGGNKVTRQLAFAWNFDRNLRAWSPAGVAGEVDAPVIPTPEGMLDLMRIRTDFADGGYRFSSGASFNDTVFLWKRLNLIDGTKVGQKYRATFTISLNRPYESYPVVGMTAVSPQLERQDVHNVQLNVADALVAIPSSVRKPGVKTFTYELPYDVAPDRRGYLWLYAGADRSNGGTIPATPPVTIRSVSVVLTPVA